MATNNAINVSTAGIVGFTGTAFVETAATNHAVLVGGSTTSTFSNVGPTATAGQVLQSAGSSADPSFSTPTYPSASGSSRKLIVSDGTNNVYTTETWAVPGTSGNVLTSDGTNWTSAAPAGGGNGFPTLSNALGNLVLLDDFATPAIISGSVSLLQSVYSWNVASSWNNTPSPVNTHPGIISNISINSSTPTQNLLVGGDFPTIVLANGILQINWLFNIVNLSTVSNTYTIRVGMSNSFSSPADCLLFSYTNGTNSGNWQLLTSKASSTTTTNTSVAVTTGWHNMQIVVNAAASSVTYTIDGAAQSAIVTNIPNTSTNMRFGFASTCSNGTITANSYMIDLFYANYALTTPRT